MTLLLDSLFSSVAISHFMVDVLNGQRSVLFTYLSVPLGLSNAGLGFVTSVYTLTAALMQPLFGYLSDRIGPRWVVSGGVLWMGVLFSVGVLIPGWTGLALLAIASVGSGAFHPAGTMQATLRSRSLMAGSETNATSYFFLFGQAGFFVGPVLGGLLLDRFGPPGLIALTFLALPVGVNAAFRMRNSQPRTAANPASPVASPSWQGQAIPSLIGLALLAALSSWALHNMITFIPKFLSDLGVVASVYGLVSSLFVGGSALGNVVGGTLADRFGKRLVAASALSLACVPLLLVPALGWSVELYFLIPIAGLLVGSSHSIIVVLAQRLIPGGMGLVSGLILGFMFSAGALGTLLSGYMADLWGVAFVFLLSAGLVLVSAILALRLPKT